MEKEMVPYFIIYGTILKVRKNSLLFLGLIDGSKLEIDRN